MTRLVQTIFEQFLGIPLPFAPVSLILNAIPAIVSFKAIGKKFTLNTSMIIVVSSILTDFVPSVPITQDILLISIFGGLINGTAVSLALIGGSSTGGTDFIAVYFAEKKNKDVWNYILMGNGVVLAMAGILFGWDKALYSIIFQFTSTQVLSTVYKRYQKRTLFIITDQPEAVYKEIMENTHHGATLFRGTGLYEQKERAMVYSVVSADEIKRVLSRVRAADSHAFINCLKTDSLAGRFYRKPND